MTHSEEIIGRGFCQNCPHWDSNLNYCDIYKIYLVAPGFEATCCYTEKVKE